MRSMASMTTLPRSVTGVTKGLPPRRPAASTHRGPQAVPGNWRVDPDGCSVSECVAVKDVMGNATGAIKWEPRVQIGARIAARLMQRVPHRPRNRHRFLDPTAPVDEPRVVIEVAYRDEDGVKQTFEVVGPDKLLNGPISKWAETPKIDRPL
jgi:hypothetical protein